MYLLLFNESSTQVHALAMHYIVKTRQKRFSLNVQNCLFSFNEFGDLASNSPNRRTRESQLGVVFLSLKVTICAILPKIVSCRKITRPRWGLVFFCSAYTILRKIGNFCKNGKNRESYLGCAFLSSALTISRSQNWQFSQKSRVLVISSLLIFSVYLFCEKLQSLQLRANLHITGNFQKTVNEYPCSRH